MSDLELNKGLLAILGSQDLVDIWWRTQNKSFNYATPLSLYAYDPSYVWRYVIQHTHCEGI